MAVENFTTYTELDPNNHVTVTPTRVTRTAYANEDARVYRDFGIGHFTDFSHNIDIQYNTGQNNRAITCWQLANGLDDYSALVTAAAQDFLAVYVILIGGVPNIVLVECKGTDSTNINIGTISRDATYYLTITKIGTALTCSIYSDSSRTALVNTLSITLVDDAYAFRYLYVMNSWNVGTNEFAVGYVENLDLGGGTVSTTASGIWPRETYISGYTPRYQKRQPVGYYSDSGDLRSMEVNASGHILTDVSLNISGLDIEVNISGDPVIISGQPVTISGGHVFVESGAFVTTQPSIQVNSGILDVEVLSGEIHILSGLIAVESGLHVWISGQHVFQESGAFVTTQPGIQISGAVIVSGSVSISGNYVIARMYGYHPASGLWIPLSVTLSGCLATMYCLSGGLF